MTPILKYKWFWLTFLAWCCLGTISAWAIIFSPHQLSSRKFSEFSVQVNDTVEKNQFFISTSPADEALESITRDWEENGWKSVSRNLNLASFLLNASGDYDKFLNSLVYLRLFQNKEDYRLLGLLTDAGHQRTYQWICQIPKAPTHSPERSKNFFPVIPPSGASNLSLMKSKKMESLTWNMDKNTNFIKKFRIFYSSQGFSGNLLSPSIDREKSVYILRKGSDRIVAVLTASEEKLIISLVKIGKN